jgi:hypothetical protein
MLQVMTAKMTGHPAAAVLAGGAALLQQTGQGLLLLLLPAAVCLRCQLASCQHSQVRVCSLMVQ